MSKVMLHNTGDLTDDPDQVKVIVDKKASNTSFITFGKAHPRWFWPFVIAAAILCIVGLILIIVGIITLTGCEKSEGGGGGQPTSQSCQYSNEAQRVGLQAFLKQVQAKYFEMNPDNVAWQPDIEDRSAHMKSRYFPYDPEPMQLKKKTDAALELLDKVNNMNINVNKLKPREAKALSQVKHFLKHTFGVPYDENYYAGDWMLGPNLFCWQGICTMSYDVNALGFIFKPKSYEDIEYVIRTIMKHKQVLDQYRENVALGVRTGMVRTKIDCRAGVDALKEAYRQVSLANNSAAVLNDWFTKHYQVPAFYAKLESGVNEAWIDQNGKNVSDSVKDALKEGVGQPLLDLINYLENEHMRNCLPNDVSSGLGGLPVDYVYLDGVPDVNNKTTKRLPTGELLNGTKTYRMIISYFTTTDISPEEVYQEGKRQLTSFYSEIINITKLYTGKSNDTEAVIEFKKVLNSRSMWHNNGSFPKNESDKNAFKKCVSPQTAEKFCPVRWAAVQRWAKYCRQVMGMLYPKLTKLFYFTGAKATAPNCPVEMQPHYNPSNGAQFFKNSNSRCSVPTYFGLPFFLKDYGPIFQEWSVTAHETRPGHQTQIQGVIEHFQDTCGGVPSWLDRQTFYTAFVEGWALYSENPLISDDTDTYKDNMLQRYGMLKWQAWRAVRLIVDTGLHARGMTRTQALKMFEDYAWDTSDFAVKEVTRYQSDPGQATAYMLGRLELIKTRKKAEQELGSLFNLQDFHYQVLKQGSAPLEFLKSHIDRYIKCMKGQLTKTECQYILPSQEKTTTTSKLNDVEDSLPPRPTPRHYV